MERIISKEELEELKKLKGEARGIALKDGLKFVLEKEGREGLRAVEEIVAKEDSSFSYNNIRIMGFYPIWMMALILVAIQRIFGYDDKKFQELGRFGAKSPLILRLYLRYFVSIKRAVNKIQDMHNKYFTFGSLEVVELNEKEKYIILRRKNFKIHPIHCQISKGYFSAIAEMIVGKEVAFKETRCIYRGDNYHEFVLRW